MVYYTHVQKGDEMSKGSKIVPVRMNAAELAALQNEVARYNANPLNAELSVSEWIRKAIRDKIDHATRSRRKANPRVQKRLAAFAVDQNERP
jgi:hypothetical protein